MFLVILIIYLNYILCLSFHNELHIRKYGVNIDVTSLPSINKYNIDTSKFNKTIDLQGHDSRYNNSNDDIDMELYNIYNIYNKKLLLNILESTHCSTEDKLYTIDKYDIINKNNIINIYAGGLFNDFNFIQF